MTRLGRNYQSNSLDPGIQDLGLQFNFYIPQEFPGQVSSKTVTTGCIQKSSPLEREFHRKKSKAVPSKVEKSGTTGGTLSLCELQQPNQASFYKSEGTRKAISSFIPNLRALAPSLISITSSPEGIDHFRLFTPL